MSEEALPSLGWVAPDVAAEFPELRLLAITLAARNGRSAPGVRLRLRQMSDRFRGPQAVTMRADPVPHAYRVFFRHIGLDPDVDRTPIEAAALQRLIEGQFKPRNLLDDAQTVSLMETGVPIWALDADCVDGELGIRAAGPAERVGRGTAAMGVTEGRLVVADARSPLGVLFGELGPGHDVTKATRRMTLFALQVAGVPSIHVEEALFTCVEALRAA